MLTFPTRNATGETSPDRAESDPKMADMPKHAAAPWTWRTRLLATLLTLMGVIIAGLAFKLLYETVTSVERPYLHGYAWVVVICGEITFSFLYLAGVLLHLKRVPSGAFRPALMALLVAGSIWLYVYAAHGSVASAVGHLIVGCAFYGVLLSAKEIFSKLRGGRVRHEGITAVEWALHPLLSARVWRWMQAWAEPSREAALRRYLLLLFVQTVAQADDSIGRVPLLWRRRLPPLLRYQFSMGLLPQHLVNLAAVDGEWQEAAAAHVRLQLAVQSGRQADDTAQGSSGGTADGTSGDRADDTNDDTNDDIGDRRRARSDDTLDRSTWPETKDIERAVLLRRIRNEDAKWKARHDGQPLPAARLSEQLRVRMSRETAGPLLAEARAQGSPEPHPGPVRGSANG